MKRIFAVLLIAALVLAGCGADGKKGEASEIGFSDAVTFETLEALNGKNVSIIGYMATISPISGKFMYLMNMPYQSCPFCLPNTTQLSNTMAVYAPKGKTFQYTDQAIRVTGVMAIEDMVDEFGYSYNYRIKDATYEVVDLSEISEEYALWQTIAADGIVAEINSMFDYVYFLCQWTEFQGGYTDENGNTVEFYMYPGDVYNYLQDEGPYGYHEEYSESYFPGLISRIRAISPDRLEALVSIVEEAKALSEYALRNLNDAEYTYDEGTDKFTLNNANELYDRFYDVYYKFSDWLATWEM